MTVVVTGASGHLGTNLVGELLRAGRRVRVLVHNDRDGFAELGVECVHGDVRDPASLRAAFDGADVLYHLAGVISIDGGRGGLVDAVNVEGAGNVAEAALAAGVRRMVHFSSIHAFRAEPLDQPLDETRERVGPEAAAYDRSKTQGEARVRDAIARGLDAVIVHPTGVIGPNDRAPSRMGRTFLDFVAGTLPAGVPGGFNFVDVRDVVSSAFAAEERGRTGESYILGGHDLTVVELLGVFEQVTGVAPPRLTPPLPLVKLGALPLMLWGRLTGQEPLYTLEMLRTLQGNRDISSAKAARELGHSPYTTRETVEAMYKSFLDRDQIQARS